MKVAYAHEMRRMDERAINEYGIPGVVLMENAALSVVKHIQQKIKEVQNPKILIVCGTGNNGGDGFTIGRHLYQSGCHVTILLVGKIGRISGDAFINYNICTKLGMNILQFEQESNHRYSHILKEHQDIIVDALFGTGLTRNIEGSLANLIADINEVGGFKVAVDLPSGISADTGKVLGVAFKADLTVTFGVAKPGLLLYPGAAYAGKVICDDISLPKDILLSDDLKGHQLLRHELKALLPKRFPWSHKGSYGKVGIIAGSEGMTGAAILSGTAAYRIGAGLVKLIVPESIMPIVQNGLREAVCVPYSVMKNQELETTSLQHIKEGVADVDAVVIGPGLSKGEWAKQILRCILKEAKVPVVIDADGLNIIAKQPELLQLSKATLILTPHLGEMSRLSGALTKDIAENILVHGQAYSKANNTILVLKDARTVISNDEGEFFINTVGNHGMSTAGAGDVLAGIIGGLIAQGVEPFKSAYVGVYIHGLAGDIGAKAKGKNSLMATDICDYITKVEELG